VESVFKSEDVALVMAKDVVVAPRARNTLAYKFVDVAFALSNTLVYRFVVVALAPSNALTYKFVDVAPFWPTEKIVVEEVFTASKRRPLPQAVSFAKALVVPIARLWMGLVR
jgi:hypothetical protein